MIERKTVERGRWWCPYDRAWMSATLTADIDGESFIECLNCGGVIARLAVSPAERVRAGDQAAQAGVP